MDMLKMKYPLIYEYIVVILFEQGIRASNYLFVTPKILFYAGKYLNFN